MQQSAEKRPISPADLFKALMQGNFKQAQCVDQGERAREQRAILISLISEYRQQIAARAHTFDKVEQLLLVRDRLRGELEGLRQERITIDKNLQYQIERNKLTPVEMSDHAHWVREIQQWRFNNEELEKRLLQLREYAASIESKNAILEKQNKMVMQAEMRLRSSSELNAGQTDMSLAWRERVRGKQESFQRTMLEKRRAREESNIMEIRLKEAEIEERNRRRMSSLHERYKFKL